jgi:hypothetical protein
MIERLYCIFGYHNPNLKTKLCEVCHKPVNFGHKEVCPKCGTWTATRFSRADIWCWRCDTTYNVISKLDNSTGEVSAHKLQAIKLLQIKKSSSAN